MEKTYKYNVTSSKSERLRAVRESLKMTQKDFAGALSMDSTNITKYESGKMKIGKNLEYKLFMEFPSLSPLWWETGEGEMFTHGLYGIATEPIEPYKLHSKIPFYDTDSFGVATGMIEMPFFMDCDFAVRVYGGGIPARFLPGDIIFCKEVSHFREFVTYGEVYLVLYGDGERHLKYIKRSSKDGYYCLSTDITGYDDYDVPVSLIGRVFLVRWRLEKMSI